MIRIDLQIVPYYHFSKRNEQKYGNLFNDKELHDRHKRGDDLVRYIAKRLIQTILLVFLVSVVTYFLVEMIPGDRVYLTYGEGITREQYAEYYVKLGLDKPVIMRYLSWLGNALKGDFGRSTQYKQPVTNLVMMKLPITVYLSIISGLISMPLGIWLGVKCATHQGKWQDSLFTSLANVIGCLPSFWLAMVLMLEFSLRHHWFPSFGFTWFTVDVGDHFRKLAMPLVCLVIGEVAGICRQTRSSVLECIRQDYVRTARAKGVPERVVIRVHVMKNAMIPIITLIGSRLAGLIGGSLFVETVFSIPGMGVLLQTAITTKDIPILIAIVCLTALVSGVAYILTDIAYMVCDPRIVLTGEKGR